MGCRAGMIPLAQAAIRSLPIRILPLTENCYIHHNLHKKAALVTNYSNLHTLGALGLLRKSGSLSRGAAKYSTSYREPEELSAKTDEGKDQKNILICDTTSENWTIKMLYDGECPLCMREVNMLQERNKDYGAIRFVDISALDYSPEENAGIDYETAMGRIHAILKDGTVLQNVAAFKRLYEEVGLGWVYAVTNYEPFSSIAEAIYDIWAKYRLPITGRPPLEHVLEQKKQQKVDCDDNRCKTKAMSVESQ